MPWKRHGFRNEYWDGASAYPKALAQLFFQKPQPVPLCAECFHNPAPFVPATCIWRSSFRVVLGRLLRPSRLKTASAASSANMPNLKTAPPAGFNDLDPPINGDLSRGIRLTPTSRYISDKLFPK